MDRVISIYVSEAAKEDCLNVYTETLAGWPVAYEESLIPTRFGETHILTNGPADGKPLVLLHGQWTTSGMWRPFIAGLSAGRRVYAVDQIDDAGRSRPTCLPVGRGDYAAWMTDVFNGLGLIRADLAGLSYGGFLALNFALAAPERIGRLALLSPGLPALGNPTPRWGLHGMPAILLPTRATAEWLARCLSARPFDPRNPETRQLVASLLALRSHIPVRPAVEESEIARVACPTLLLIGEREAMYSARAAIEKARALFPNLQAEVIPAAGHMLGSDQPELVLNRLVEFLSSEVDAS